MGQGFKDSITGTSVVFYLDNEVNKKMQMHSPDVEPISVVNSKSSSFRKQDAAKVPEWVSFPIFVFAFTHGIPFSV